MHFKNYKSSKLYYLLPTLVHIISIPTTSLRATMDHMLCCHLLANQATKGVPIKALRTLLLYRTTTTRQCTHAREWNGTGEQC
jgi:hypothetical protein